MSGFRIRNGTCHPLYCFELGFSIDLDAAARVLTGSSRAVLTHREHPAGPFEYSPAPLKISEPLGITVAPPFRLGPSVELVLYDFLDRSYQSAQARQATPRPCAATSDE